MKVLGAANLLLIELIPYYRTLPIFNFYGLGRIEYGSIDFSLICIKDF